MRVDVVQGDQGDWIGIYVDGELKHEGHSLEPGDVLRAVGIGYEWREVRIIDHLPMKLSEVKS